MTPSIRGLGVLLVGAALLAGCATMPPPTARLASSAAAIRAAQELRATDTPAAQLRLQYAVDQYELAKKLLAAGENEKAELVLARSEADAELAVAIAKQMRSEQAAVAAQVELQKVNTK